MRMSMEVWEWEWKYENEYGSMRMSMEVWEWVWKHENGYGSMRMRMEIWEWEWLYEHENGSMRIPQLRSSAQSCQGGCLALRKKSFFHQHLIFCFCFLIVHFWHGSLWQRNVLSKANAEENSVIRAHQNLSKNWKTIISAHMSPSIVRKMWS